RNILIHNGPIIIRENGAWSLKSFMPTSSIRFEKWGAKSVENWGLRMIVGKTTMGAETAAMMREKGCVHVSPRSVSPNLWIDSIEVQDVHLFDELGSIEAAWFFKVHELGPFLVDIDSTGANFFDRLDGEIAANKEAALRKLGIGEDFSFTKLY
ncbi:MAG: fumarate hydratase C-terminal domain-containing protein, partial [Oscillospiraceae bacterium]|nr:fumarate hydratase C-terminal domain-containing protein [Oscillospiraceae bacterium]